jgi:hypothetical protein
VGFQKTKDKVTEVIAAVQFPVLRVEGMIAAHPLNRLWAGAESS